MSENSSKEREAGVSPPLFDTAGLWKLLSDVQQLGFETASTLIDQFRDIAERSMPTTPGGEQGAAARGEGPSGSRLRDSVQRMTDASVEMMMASWEALSSVMTVPSRGGGDRRGETVEVVELPKTAPGATASATSWLHNDGSETVSGIELRAGDLVTPDGATIGADSVSFNPKTVDSLAPRSSRPIRIMVDVPKKATAGIYHGVVLAPPLAGPVLVMSLPVAPSS